MDMAVRLALNPIHAFHMVVSRVLTDDTFFQETLTRASAPTPAALIRRKPCLQLPAQQTPARWKKH
jgi:hypothetical protein